MAWSKAPQSLVDLFAVVLPNDVRVERRKIFGYPAAFVNGNMFAGLFQDQMFARLAPDERAALEAAHGPLPFEPMAGRPMKDYTRLPDEVLEDEGEATALMARAFRWSAALPAKVKKPKAK
ncbi:MAG TPA: TfoX/Sxy family protein [Caulobacteraceae bacterium]|nr:TfoX/Sxy family protein [Caulobacteraceae bacterium]